MLKGGFAGSEKLRAILGSHPTNPVLLGGGMDANPKRKDGPKPPTPTAGSDLASVHETANQIADAIFDRAKPPDPARRVRKGKRQKRTR